MSKVISFRLNPENAREAKALEILKTKQSEGFSRRRILTDALIGMVAENRLVPVDDFNIALEQVANLLEQLNGIDQNTIQPKQSETTMLNDNFLTSVRIAARPGINLD